MELKLAKQRFQDQRQRAKKRGIEWQLTFEQWLEWWGADLDNRGQRAWNLQMQRIGDSGPYALGNVRKGHPKDNSKTNQLVQATKRTLRRAAEIEVARDNDPGTWDGSDGHEEDESISSYMSRDPDHKPRKKGKWEVIHG